MNYAISICGFNSTLIKKPFIAHQELINKLIMLTTNDIRSQDTYKNVSDFLNYLNAEAVPKKINNIYDFYEISITLESIKREYGIPKWINVTAGPGIAISSLTIFAINNNIPVLSYSQDKELTSIIDVSASKKMFIYMEKSIKILESLIAGPKTLQELALILNVSKSTISRKVFNLKKTSFVKTENNKRSMVVSLTEAALCLFTIKNNVN